MKIKAWVPRLWVDGFEFYKKRDISIIILMKENIQMSNKKIVNNNWGCHYPTRVGDQISIAYICFLDKNQVTMYIYKD